jgi:hypothetical protein
MDPNIVSLFAQFGYPALVSGFLLYILVNRLEKVLIRLEAVEKVLIAQDDSLKEYRQEVREACAEVKGRT